MTVSMYQASVPAFQQTLEALSAILTKAVSYAEARKIEPATLLTARLYPDMFTLTRQVQLSCDFAKNTAGRLAGVEPPKFEDTEQSFPELQARIEKTLTYLKGFKADQIDGSEGRTITIPLGGEPRNFTGQNYLIKFALPNYYFHVTTAYGILRHCGLEVGKRDFLGQFLG